MAGCSSVQVLETWKGSTVTAAKPFSKVLVVNVNLDENVRKMYEDIVVGEMGDSKISAVAGHKHVKIKDNYKRSEIAAAVRETGSDAVMIIRNIETGNQKISQQGQGSVLYGEGFLPSSWDMMEATMQVNLYSTATEQLVWSATFKATDADHKFDLSRDMGLLIIKLLRNDGLL